MQPKHTIRESANEAELKIQTDSYRIWLNSGVVEVEENQKNGNWLLVEMYDAKN